MASADTKPRRSAKESTVPFIFRSMALVRSCNLANSTFDSGAVCWPEMIAVCAFPTSSKTAFARLLKAWSSIAGRLDAEKAARHTRTTWASASVTAAATPLMAFCWAARPRWRACSLTLFKCHCAFCNLARKAFNSLCSRPCADANLFSAAAVLVDSCPWTSAIRCVSSSPRVPSEGQFMEAAVICWTSFSAFSKPSEISVNDFETFTFSSKPVAIFLNFTSSASI
mmetsp:Transcript_115446/g.246739  ORF Transcript_115446/g.246739 Transcript_115446/m.246739 type:complete len:226 (+) Transcript_115446:178-855(+)